MQSANAGLAAVALRRLGEQPEAVLRVRQVIAQRSIRAVRLDLVASGSGSDSPAVAVFGLVGIEDLRLQIAALLRAARRRGRSSEHARPAPARHIEYLRLKRDRLALTMTQEDITTRLRILSCDLIDIGSNLTHDSFAADRDAVMARALEAGVRAANCHRRGSGEFAPGGGISPPRIRMPVEHRRRASASRAELRPARSTTNCASFCACRRWSRSANAAWIISAISRRRPAQRAAFIAQLEIAAAGAQARVSAPARRARRFCGDPREISRRPRAAASRIASPAGARELEDYLALGLYIGITGWVCDERRGASLREAVPRIPADRLMIETDAPYLLPRDLEPRPKSRRNEPAYLPHIAARSRGCAARSLEAVAAATTRNAVQFFGSADCESTPLQVREQVRARPQLRDQPVPGLRDIARARASPSGRDRPPGIPLRCRRASPPTSACPW